MLATMNKWLLSQSWYTLTFPKRWSYCRKIHKHSTPHTSSMEPNRNITKETGTEIQAVGKRLHLLLSLLLFPLDICVDEGATAVECILNVLFSLYLVLRRWILKRNKSPGFSYRARKRCQCWTPEAINDMNVPARLQCTSTNIKK